MKVDDEAPAKVALDRAWTVYLATHGDVDSADARQCTLARYLQREWAAGQTNPDEVVCSGLMYLSRLPSDTW
jgi:hypothetical protein